MKLQSTLRSLSGCLALSALLFTPLATAQAQEQDEMILTVYEVTVKHGQDSKWRAGVKAWNQCYAENGGKQSWGAWRRLQGDGSVYAFTVTKANWAGFDSDDAAVKACEDVYTGQLTPYEEGEVTLMAKLIPELSTIMKDSQVVNVINFRTSDGVAFRKVITDVSKAMQKTDNTAVTEWYEVLGGGPGSGHYFVVSQHANFASLDQDLTGPWQAVEQQHGKETAEKWRAMFRAVLDDSWSYLYRRINDLSYQPAENQ